MGEAGGSRGGLIAAFAAVYLVWGSTYLGMAVMVETLPPFAAGGARFILAGALLYAWQRLRGEPTPTAPQWRAAALVGALLFVGGNGGVVWGLRWVPSGIAALLVATTPVFMTALPWLVGRGERPALAEWAGLALGLLGVAILVGEPGPDRAGGHEVLGACAIVAGTLAWATGSLVSRALPQPPSSLMASAAQMLCGGAAMLAVGLAGGESVALGSVSARSWTAFAYLVLIGSLVGFAAFTYLLRRTTPSRVATYAFVNPVVAVVLGWALLDERLGGRQWLAAALILAAVALILAAPRRAVPTAAAPAAPAPPPAPDPPDRR